MGLKTPVLRPLMPLSPPGSSLRVYHTGRRETCASLGRQPHFVKGETRVWRGEWWV